MSDDDLIAVTGSISADRFYAGEAVLVLATHGFYRPDEVMKALEDWRVFYASSKAGKVAKLVPDGAA